MEADSPIELTLTDVESEYCYDAFFQRKDGIRLTFSMDSGGSFVPATHCYWSPVSDSASKTISVLRGKRGQKSAYVMSHRASNVLCLEFEDGTKFSQEHGGLNLVHTSAYMARLAELNPVPETPRQTQDTHFTDSERAAIVEAVEELRRDNERRSTEQEIEGKLYSLGRNLEMVDAVLKERADGSEDAAEYGLKVTLKKAGNVWTEDWRLPNASPGSIKTAAAFLRSKRGETIQSMIKCFPEMIVVEFDSGSMWRASMPAKPGAEKTKFLFLDFE
jgi:hypothetical protein